MKKIWETKLLLCLLSAVLLVLTLCVVFPQTAKAADTDRYGYSKLENEVQKKTYVKIADALAACEDELSLSGQNCTENDLKVAAEMVRRDYPEFFYYQKYAYSLQGGLVQSVEFRYAFNGKELKGDSSELKNAIKTLDTKVKDIVKGAKGDDYQKALYLHDYVVNNVIYQSSINDQNAYGALIEGKAVCAGYSHAYQLLLRKAGIESFYITGTSRGVKHAWLLVFLDDECYYTDVTWDDPVLQGGTQVLGHYYFDMSYDQISKDHTADPEYSKWLPSKHDHKSMYYFEHDAREGNGVGRFNDNVAPGKLFEYMKQDGNKYYCEFIYDGTDFDSWFNDALQNVANQVGEISISYVPLGNEYILTITAKASEHVLQKVSAKAPTCTGEGNTEHYECTKCGKRFADPEAKKTITNDSCIIIERLTHSDGNGDNRCDSCGRKMSNSSSTTPTTPSTEATTPPTEAPEETTPVTEATTPVTEATTPATDATEETEPSGAATEETQQPTEETQQPTEETTPSEDGNDATAPSEDATAPTEGAPADGNEPMDPQFFVMAGIAIAAIAVIAVVVSVLRRKKA